MNLLIDPRRGDAEDDFSSTKQRSLFAVAGSLLSEISLPKLIIAWGLLIVAPAVLLGMAPLLVSSWLGTFTSRLSIALAGIVPLLLVIGLVLLAWFGGRPLWRAAERSFWSLNSLAVQPSYAFWREALRHLVDKHAGSATAEQREKLRAATAFGSSVIVCGFAVVLVLLALPHARWLGMAADLMSPRLLVVPAIANSLVIMGAYLAAAALAWGFADGTMAQPRDLEAFDTVDGTRQWRVAHLSDIHIVGEDYGFRIESGRSGARGNDALEQVLSRLEEIHAEDPLDLVLVTGDITDAGRSAEWAEFLDALDRHPALVDLLLFIPGNHDINVVDRANPARLDLPMSSGRRLRQMRMMSVMEAVQGRTVCAGERASSGLLLADWLRPHRAAMTEFADTGTFKLSIQLSGLWDDAFPLVMLPAEEDGLGVLLLDSNAETHFSFTNALGSVSVAQVQRLSAILDAFPRAHWIVALHHHPVEYPHPAKALSERVGTALINGSWFVRHLFPHGKRIVAMHGHRHIDWIGACADVRIISAPSPVMVPKGEGSEFLIHTLAAGPEGRLLLAAPERVHIPPAG